MGKKEKDFEENLKKMNEALASMQTVLDGHKKENPVIQINLSRKMVKPNDIENKDNYTTWMNVLHDNLTKLSEIDSMKPEFENKAFADAYKTACDCSANMIDILKKLDKNYLKDKKEKAALEKKKLNEKIEKESKIKPQPERKFVKEPESQEGETQEPEINSIKEFNPFEEIKTEIKSKPKVKFVKEPESQEGETKEPEISVKKSSTVEAADNSSEPSMKTFYNEFVDLGKKQKWNSTAYNDLVFSIGVYVKERGKHEGDQEWKINIIKKINKRLDAYMDMVKKRDSTASNSMERSEKYKCCVRFKEYFGKTFPNALARITASQKAYDEHKNEIHTEMEKNYGNLFIGGGF